MRSEGFPFIVGVWGWTCVRVAFVVSSSPRRRLVVVSSSRRRRQLVNSLPLGGTFALRRNPYLQSVTVEEVSHEMLVLALSSHKM